MSSVSRDWIHRRIRRLFLEEVADDSTTDFIDRSDFPNEIDQAYDEGCHRQHAVVLKNAQETGLLETHDNLYLQKYIAHYPFNVAIDVRDYPCPRNLYRRLWLSIDDLRGVYVQPQQDRLISTWPSQYGPAKGETIWTVLARGVSSPPSPNDTQRVLRIYVYGNKSVPMQTARGEFVYYRELYLMAHQSPPAGISDVEDPYNDGPVHWAVSVLLEKAQNMEKAMQLKGMAEMLFNLIIPPAQPPQERAR